MSSLAVSNVSLLGTDSVQLMIRPRVDFSLISGFMFHSMWANLAAEHYFQFARFILTGAFCFMFLAFFIRLKFGADKSSQTLLAVGICSLREAPMTQVLCGRPLVGLLITAFVLAEVQSRVPGHSR
jgi:hypothetical protein